METRTYKLITFHDNKAVLVEDNEIPYAGDTHALCLSEIQYGFKEAYVLNVQNCHSCRRIVATNFLPKLPFINFNHLDLGVPDVQMLASEHAFCFPASMSQDEYDMLANGFYNGYDDCLKHTAYKMFTEEDMANFGQYCIRQYQLFKNHDHDFAQRTLPKYIQDVFKPKVFDVEVEVFSVLQAANTVDWIPLVKNGCIKIIKIIKLCTD